MRVLKSNGELTLKIHGDSTVVGATTRAGDQIFSVYEFMNVVCGRTGYYSAGEWKRMQKSYNGSKKRSVVSFNEDVIMMRLPEYNPRFLGRPPPLRASPAMTVEGLSRLLPKLGDRVLPDVRGHVERVLESYTAGDRSMVEAGASA